MYLLINDAMFLGRGDVGGQAPCGPRVLERLVEIGGTGLIEDLISKRGATFSAYFVLSMDKKQTEFEFPRR